MTRSLATLLVVAVWVMTGCKHPKRFPQGPQQDARVEAPPEPPMAGGPILPEELLTAQEGCTRYVALVCDCAKQKPAFQSQCELVSGQPDAIRLAKAGLVETADGGPDPDVLWQNIREIARACMRGEAAFKCE